MPFRGALRLDDSLGPFQTVRCRVLALLANHVDIHHVDIQLCGQSAARYDISASDLLPGVRLALSAMTAYAQLQQ